MAYKKNTIHKQENDALHQKEAQTAAVDNKSLPGKRGGQAKEYLGTIRIMDSMIANKSNERDHFRRCYKVYLAMHFRRKCKHHQQIDWNENYPVRRNG